MVSGPGREPVTTCLARRASTTAPQSSSRGSVYLYRGDSGFSHENNGVRAWGDGVNDSGVGALRRVRESMQMPITLVRVPRPSRQADLGDSGKRIAKIHPFVSKIATLRHISIEVVNP